MRGVRARWVAVVLVLALVAGGCRSASGAARLGDEIAELGLRLAQRADDVPGTTYRRLPVPGDQGDQRRG